MLSSVNIESLIDAGVHFGHKAYKWNPKMKEYIYGAKDGIHIINLDYTMDVLNKSIEFLKTIVAEKGKILFVGTNPNISDYLAEVSVNCGQFYVNQRWLGGTLTNWFSVSKSIAKIGIIENKLKDEKAMMLKKERLMLGRNLAKLQKNLSGIRTMGGAPNLIIVLDVHNNRKAILEANKMHIPVIGICDTNCDPTGVKFAIPGNDDSIRSLILYCNVFSEAIIETMNANGIDKSNPHLETKEDERRDKRDFKKDGYRGDKKFDKSGRNNPAFRSDSTATTETQISTEKKDNKENNGG